MVDKKMSLEKAVNYFIDNIANKSYRIEDVIFFIEKYIKKIPYNLYVAVDRMLRKDRRFFYDMRDEIYVPRTFFFRNAQFLIKPTQEEVRDGILFPGHRFLPFGYWEVFPATYQLRWNRQKIKTRKVQRCFQDILIYHTLLSRENIIGYLMVDCEENVDVFNKSNIFSENVSLNVFDMENFFKEHSFQFGDFLLVTVKDWKQGKYKIEHQPIVHSLQYQNQKNEWNSTLENSLLQVFEEEGTLTSIYEQLSLAFFKGRKKLIKSPSLHIGGFLEWSNKIVISSLGMTTILWRNGESPEDSIDFSVRDYDLGMTGTTDNIDGIFHDLGLALNEQVLEAFMKDELYQGKEKLENVLLRCIPHQDLKFYDKEQKKCFDTLIKKLWDTTQKNYNIFTDKTAGKYRNKALQTIESYYHWLYKLEKEGVEEKSCPKRETLALGEIQVMLMHLVAGFNDGDTEDLLKQNDMLIALDDIEYSSGALMEVIWNEAKKVSSPIFQIVKEDTNKKQNEIEPIRGHKIVYQLKISLHASSPLIWRRIQVPAEITLHDLHTVIQTAMGWSNSHLHVFSIDGLMYGEPEVYHAYNEKKYQDLGEYEEYELIDEKTISLRKLLQEKQDITYEYDLGDSWIHNIKVEKMIFKDFGEIPQIKCLNGKNACPPENCGGIYGYDEILSILQDASDPEHKKLKSWLKNFNPKSFDVKGTNKNLQKLGWGVPAHESKP